MAAGEIESIIGSGTTMNGDLKFKGQLRLEGTVEGSVVSTGDDSSQLVVGADGRVKGDIDVPNVINGGAVNGSLTARKSLNVLANGKVSGTATYGTLEVASGGHIDGELHPLSASASAPAAPKK